jgi:hypothetical protein
MPPAMTKVSARPAACEVRLAISLKSLDEWLPLRPVLAFPGFT